MLNCHREFQGRGVAPLARNGPSCLKDHIFVEIDYNLPGDAMKYALNKVSHSNIAQEYTQRISL